uniref:Uncharacterized protein n=1 Tax=Tanacetum cinerariifolium TaxID=118510 RepID=A0A6L2KFJ6_TANCI|nr:hypothetical protein [Tanacetum cinerariifolium]
MCKEYGCEPSVNLLGVSLIPFLVSFRDKLPENIYKNPFFQRVGGHPTNVRVFPDPILFMTGMNPSWEHGQQCPMIIIDGKEMAFKNFMYAETDKDLSFLSKEPRIGDAEPMEEKARKCRKALNWEIVKYGKIWYDEDIHDLRSVETEFPAIVFNDNLTSDETLSCEPTTSSLNDNEIDFRISFDESDDEDYTVVFNKKPLSYKIIYANDLKMGSKNDNEKVNMPLFPSPEHTAFVYMFESLSWNGRGKVTSN